MRNWFVVGLALVSGGCFATGGAQVSQPDVPSPNWRALVGCYQMEDKQFVLDSIPDLRLNSDRPEVQRALFAPTPPIVGGYWFVNQRCGPTRPS